MADGYFTHSFNNPSTNVNELQNFNIKSDQPNLSMAMFSVDKSDKVLGIHADVGLGDTFRVIHAADPAVIDNKGFRYVKQMYVIVKPKNVHGTEFDFGEFVTSAGAEVIESNGNWNYTRSLLFAWAIPYYHFGLRANVPVTKELAVGFQVVNAWNTLWGNNNLDNIGLTLAYTKPKFVYSLNYYEGPNHLGTTQGKRNLVDTTLLINATPKVSFYVNGDYGADNHVGTSGSDKWYGIAGATRAQITKRVALAGRAEIFDDHDGFSTGTKQVIKEGTITGEYKYNDHFLTRVELRHDASDKSFFLKDTNGAVKGMTTFTIGLVVSLGPWK